MTLVFILVITLILIIYICNYLIIRSKRDTYQKAGEKWDMIVKELRRRK